MLTPDFEKNPPLILVVDDETSIRMTMALAMRKEGYRVAESKDGQHCLDSCQQLRPDIILMDAMMPQMDGFICCDRLKTQLGKDCPLILMITALDDQDSVDRAFEVGAIDYVTKPIHWPVLRQRVRRLLQTHWATIELQRQVERERLLREQLDEANQELQRLAALDGLTQIANRRSFDDYLHYQWKVLAREGAPLSLILGDVDFFKRYNDTYGHQGGDDCLRQVAKTICEAVKRPSDLVARYGGEEFAVILPNTEAEGAVTVAQEIRAGLKALGLVHASSQVSKIVTLSLGVASVIPSQEYLGDRLIAEADEALYAAKKQGRDRIFCKSSTGLGN